jgi:serine/threonine protein kinase
MEMLKGGDLFTHLERRKFRINEDRAREICHQLATAVFYLHSFGIAHRDLKPENILMTEDTDISTVRVVDFGLSKIVGPNETCLEPFGTLVISIH